MAVGFSPMIRACSKRRQGTTVIESIFVVILIGILAALAVPKINGPGFRADAAAREARTTLQIAQRLAVTRQYDVIVSFDTVAQSIRVVEDRNNNGQADSSERATWHPLPEGTHFAVPPVGLFGPVTQSISGSDVVTIDGMPSVIYMRAGTASTDLEVYLTSLLPEPDYFRGIAVTQATGRSAFSKYIGGQWLAGSI